MPLLGAPKLLVVLGQPYPRQMFLPAHLDGTAARAHQDRRCGRKAAWFETNEVAQKTFRPLEVFTVTALTYFAVIRAVSAVVHRVDRRLAMSGEGLGR